MFDCPHTNTSAHNAIFESPSAFIERLRAGEFDASLATRSLGNTPLMLALKTGQEKLAVAIVKHAITCGVDVGIDLHDKKGCFPIHWAAQLRMDRTITALMDAGAVVCPVKADCWADGMLGDIDPATLTPATLYKADWALENVIPCGEGVYQDAGPEKSVHNPMPVLPTLGDIVFHGTMLGQRYCGMAQARFVMPGVIADGETDRDRIRAATRSMNNFHYNFQQCREQLLTAREARMPDAHILTRLAAFEREDTPSADEVDLLVVGRCEAAALSDTSAPEEPGPTVPAPLALSFGCGLVVDPDFGAVYGLAYPVPLSDAPAPVPPEPFYDAQPTENSVEPLMWHL